MGIRVAMVGAGSVGFTRGLMHDIVGVPELQDTTFALTDISERNLEMVAELCRRDLSANGLPAKVEATTDRRSAVTGADYVLCMIRQGGLEAFATDIEIPLKYGVDQCVGDTLCAGGLMYAQRTIPALLDICRDIREVARPGAILLNYANPMAMNTMACNLPVAQGGGGVQTVGLCHGVQGAHWQLTVALEVALKSTGRLPKDYETPGGAPRRFWMMEELGFKPGMHRSELDVIFAGINHQTWCVSAKFRGEDVLPLLREWMPKIPAFARTEKVRLDVLKRFGYYSTESNGHLSEYVPWYRKRTDEIARWIDDSAWIHGETGGYLRVCTEGRNWFETDYPNWLKQPAPDLKARHRGQEHGSYIIEALETGRIYRGHFNVINQGQISNLPEGCCIEVPGYVDRTGIHIPRVGALPMACAATCSASVHVQMMGVRAALDGDVTLLKQAMLHDPLVGAVCDPEEVWQMADELLVAQARWLPQYAGAVPAAAERLREAERTGTRVKLRATRGAVRKATKTVAEMQANAEEARSNAQAADKGKMTAVK